MAIVSVRNIKKTYNKGKVVALRDLSFDVEEGEIYGIIGPDGAGKTSLFRILTTLLLADRGTASVDGLDVLANYKEIRKRIGYMPGKFSLYQDLSIEENLEFFATIFGTTIEENYNLVKDIYQQIEKFKTRKAGKLSGGMKQKLQIKYAKSIRGLLRRNPTAVSFKHKETFADLKRSMAEKLDGIRGEVDFSAIKEQTGKWLKR